MSSEKERTIRNDSMIVFIVFAVVLLLLAVFTAKEKDWFSSVIYALLAGFFVWVYFLSNV